MTQMTQMSDSAGFSTRLDEHGRSFCDVKLDVGTTHAESGALTKFRGKGGAAADLLNIPA